MMAWFLSPRERRLWMWTVVVVAGVYSTLGLAGVLPSFLEELGLGAVLFSTAMLLVGATVVVLGLGTRPSRLQIGVVLGVAAVYLTFFMRLTHAERTHLIEYGVIAVFIYEALRERRAQGGRVPVPAFLAIFMASLVGVLDEFIQVFLPSRVYDPVDILFNVLAATMSIAARVAVDRATKRKKTLPKGFNAPPTA